MASQILALYNFDGGKAPCIGTVSAILQPALPNDYNKRIEKVCQLMTEKTPVIVRWPKHHTSSWSLQEYVKGVEIDSNFRSGRVVMLSDDKDLLNSTRDRLLKEAGIETPRSITPNKAGSLNARRSLAFERTTTSSENPGAPATDDASIPLQQLPVVEKATASVRRPRDSMEEENVELKAKVMRLEDELENLKTDCTEREGQIVYLKDKIEKMEAEQPDQLITGLKTCILDLKTMLGSGHTLAHHVFPVTPSSSRSCTPPATPEQRMIPLDAVKFPSVMVEYNALRDACSYGRDSSTPESLNAMIGTLIDFFIRPSEQHKYSLTGRACRSIPNSKPKEPFPVDVLNAMINFALPRWEKWHHVKTTKKAIKAAVTAKLVSSHSCHLSKRKKNAVLNDPDRAHALEDDILNLEARQPPPPPPPPQQALPPNAADGAVLTGGGADEFDG